MQAGNAHILLGTKIKVVSVGHADRAIGVVGSIGNATYPFSDMPETLLGVIAETRGTVSQGAEFPDNRIGLVAGDVVEVIGTGERVQL